MKPYFQNDFTTIYRGDCLELLPQIETQFDLILCDLPYGSTENVWDKRVPLEPLWQQYNRIIKPNGAILLTAQQPFATDLINSNRKMFRYEIIWEKTIPLGYVNANRMPLRSHEQILVFYKALPTYNPQMTIGEPFGNRKRKAEDFYQGYSKHTRTQKENHGTRFPKSVVKFSNRDKRNTVHPTQKPLALMDYLIRTYTNEGEIVLDNCFGSGTTLVAAQNLCRRSVGIEQNEQFCQIAIERLAQSPLIFSEAI